MIEKKLEGKTFVITGKLSIKREEMKKEIETHGGRVVGAVSAQTDYLVVGAKAGGKKLVDSMNYKHIEMITEAKLQSIL